MKEPNFIPKDGQVDYTNIRYAPVINTVVFHDGRILLVQRSKSLRLYPSCWNGVSGFLDDSKTIEQKVEEELREELSISKTDIVDLKRGRPLIQEAPDYNKTWLVVPVRVEVSTNKFKLDWEAEDAKWFTPAEASRLDLMPGFREVLAQFIR